MTMSDETISREPIPVLPQRVPVEMPELPAYLVITTAEQFKATADLTRSRILGIIQNEPATAKQIAERLGIAPGAAGHHLQVLEAAGLAQVVARRQVRGTIAKYYTRTARLFSYDVSPDITGGIDASVDILGSALRELNESLAEGLDDKTVEASFPHARLSAERAQVYAQRLTTLLEDLLREPQDPDGMLYGVCSAMFVAPGYLQARPATTPRGKAVETPANEGGAK